MTYSNKIDSTPEEAVGLATQFRDLMFASEPPVSVLAGENAYARIIEHYTDADLDAHIGELSSAFVKSIPFVKVEALHPNWLLIERADGSFERYTLVEDTESPQEPSHESKSGHDGP